MMTIRASVTSTVLLTVAMIISSADAKAQQSKADSADAGPPGTTRADTSSDTLSTVVVTGTSIHTDTSVYQSAPVKVITSDAIKSSGAANIEQYFQTQPDFILSGQSSHTNTDSSTGLNGTGIGGTNLNLRGIGPQYTLILLNGRRFQSEDPANLDLIPLDAIDRVEVLKSGASSVYGSDAVAGVVNIITKRTADGLSLEGQYGRTTQGGNPISHVSASWGQSTDKLNVFVTAEFYRRGGLTAGQRSVSSNPDLSRFNPNFDYQVYPYSTPAQIILPDGTGPLALDQTRFSCGGFSRNPADFVAFDPHLYATSCGARLNELKKSLINSQRKGTAFVAADYTLPNGATLYGDFDFARSSSHSVATLYGTDGFGDPASDVPLSPIPASNYWNPFGVDLVDVTYGLPELGPQTLNITSTAWRANLGIKGALGRIQYDVGGVYYHSYANVFQGGVYSNQGIYDAESRPGPDALNMFCNACNTPAQLAGVAATSSVQNWEDMALFNAHAYAPVYSLPTGDINAALGAEYQRDTYIVQPDAFMLAHGLNVDYSSPADAGRRYMAVYVEGQVPVFGKDFTLPGFASLGIDAAARYENIQSVGSRTDPTVSVRWEPIADVVAFRGSYGTSFRAPPLTAINAPQTLSVFAGTDPATGQPQSYVEIGGGNKNLKPETASYTSYGLVLTPPVPGHLTLQLDRWFIRQKHIVIITDPQLVIDGIQPGGTFTAPNGEPGVYSLYMNAEGQQVNGTDLNLDYRFHTDSAGSFDFTLAGTYLNSFKVDAATGAGFIQYAGNTAQAGSLTDPAGLPKTRFLFSGNWGYGAFSTTYLLHYTGSYTDPTIPGGVSVDKYITHDIQFNVDCHKLVSSGSWLAPLAFTLGINDFTDAKTPIFYGGVPGSFHNMGYDTSIVDPAGRSYYATVHLSFPRQR
ncbi:MAG: TonB-dependent receptor [Proteobacteria bacterium]|nr:TonB-dependent receptor [Pseudomonadota bacterium]